MSIPLNTNIMPGVPAPLDARVQVQTYGDLANIPVIYIGLKVYVANDNKEYRYYSGGWQEWSSQGGGGGGAAVWGSITGTITNQTDLMVQFGLKFDKVGGTISGFTQVLASVEAYNHIITGSTSSAEVSPFAKLVSVPISATAPGSVGEYAVDANYVYFCILADTWVRAAVSTWV
ncbi:hypothetical protein LCGC14_1256570 [marine sediment metagenome]|uniref:Uncharacterized protein n=1 Tax=marine sediment metagenome TaxID=412755 RepID=A0A0F9NIJ8_9ZZZZ